MWVQVPPVAYTAKLGRFARLAIWHLKVRLSRSFKLANLIMSDKQPTDIVVTLDDEKPGEKIFKVEVATTGEAARFPEWQNP
jgi:hypothetical protein